MFSPGKFPPLCAAALIVLSILPPPAAHGRERTRFDEDWKFHLLDASVGEAPGVPAEGTQIAKWRWQAAVNPAAEAAEVSRADFDDSKWTEITSAHQVIRQENSFAWFRAVLAKPPGTQPVVHFNSVDDTGIVFLNGRKLPTPQNWNESFDVPLGAAWNPDGPNVLTVLVENNGGGGGMDEAFLRTEAEPAPELSTSGPSAEVYDDAAWRTVHLPHDFVVEGTFDPKGDSSHGFLPKTAGWYRKHFRLPEGDKDKVLWLEFDGVYRDSSVWLNGIRLGRHASGYTSFYYDISKAAHPGGDNVLSVWADARHSEGWWYEGGGIYRHVYLTKLAPVHVAHWGEYVTATPSADFQSAEVTVETDVANDSSGAAPVGVSSQLLDADGKVVGSTSVVFTESLAPSAQAKVSQRLSLPAPKLWSPDTPYLYKVQTTVWRGDEGLDRIETPVGVRSLRWDKDHGFFLNGQPYKIQGTCNHQDFAGIGIALPDHVHDYRVGLLKEMGSNAYRFSHQPMAPELLDACDRLGMLVMAENRKLGDSPEILGQVESLVRRDRNHPSVFLWSMCNEETNQGRALGAQMFTALKNEVLRWDRTRPVTCAMNGGIGQGISLVEDLQGFNYNIGSYDGFKQAFPQQPGYGSETASETTTRGIYADDKQKCYVSVYRDLHERAWKPIAESDWLAGAFVWTGFDYRGEPDPYKWPCINSPMGFMDTCGFPKDSYYYYRSEWNRAPLAHILPHWNWPGKEREEMAVQVTGNAVKYDLLLNGVSLGVKEMPPHSHIDWRVKYEPGTLETRGYNAAGEQVVADKVETTGQPTQLRITPDREHFLADGEDVVIVRCAVLDAQGRVVPTASDAVTFAVDGSAAIDGVGNGNPSDLTPDKGSRRNAFNGYCLAVVQSTGQAGVVTLTAASPGLQSATITLYADEEPPSSRRH